MSFFAPPIRPKTDAATFQGLVARGNPTSALQPEAFRDVLYDTQDITTTTTVANFFATVQTDKTLGNLSTAGALPAATFFAINCISAELLISPAAGGAVGGNGISDAGLILIAARPIVQFTIADKTYGPFPLVYAGAAGGMDIQGVGTTTADTNFAGMAGIAPNGGYFFGNTLILLPNVQFTLSVTLSSAQASLSATRKLRIALHGTRYRRVV